MAYYNGKKVMAVVDYKPATLIEKEITKNGEYNASDDNADGYSKVVVGGVKPEGNPLQDIINNQGGDGIPSCNYLFNYYKGTSLDSALSTIDASDVKNMENMFYYCTNLTTIPQLDTSKVTNMQNMFYYCTNLSSIPQLDTSNVTNMQNMFYYCTNLSSIPQLDTSKVTNMQNMFYNCHRLTSIPQLDTSNVTNMSYMFKDCTNLTLIHQLDTSNVTNMRDMFYYCTNLSSIPQLDTSNVTNMFSMFDYCSKLTSIGVYGFTRSVDISYTALGHDALVAFLNQAGTAYNSSQKITMGSTKLALLSDEEKAIATNKGWTLA